MEPYVLRGGTTAVWWGTGSVFYLLSGVYILLSGGRYRKQPIKLCVRLTSEMPHMNQGVSLLKTHTHTHTH